MVVLEAAPVEAVGRGTRRGPTGHTLLGVGAVVWALRIGLEPLGDNSFLTHLAAGRLVLEGGGVPSVDPFSFTAPGEPWVVQSWLAALLYALADRAGGGHGVLALQAALVVAMALVAVRLTRAVDGLLPRLALLAAVLAVGAGTWVERPLLLGLLFLGVALLVADGDRWAPRAPWLVAVFALWANVHGSYPLGLVLLGCLAVGSRLDGSADGGGREVRALGWAALGVLVGAVGPLGVQVLLFPVGLLGRGDVLADVVEWRAPEMTDGWQRVWLLQLMGAVVLLVRRPRWRTALPLVVFGAAAMLALRNIPVASLVLAPGMAAGLAGLGSLDGRRSGPVPFGGVVALCSVGALLVAAAAGRPAFGLEDYPGRQLALLGGSAAPAEHRIATHDFVGNWLTAHLGPGAQVFYDDRFDMYPEEVTEGYGTLLAGEPGWRDVLDRHDVDTVVWHRDEPLAALLAADPAWHVTAADHLWVTATRR